MRTKTWSLIVAGAVLGASLSTVGCAGKSKSASATPAPPPKAAAPTAPPPDMLTMKVDATPPKPPPPPPPPVKADPCLVLEGQLPSLLVHFGLDL
jgi:hypothetical protein